MRKSYLDSFVERAKHCDSLDGRKNMIPRCWVSSLYPGLPGSFTMVLMFD